MSILLIRLEGAIPRLTQDPFRAVVLRHTTWRRQINHVLCGVSFKLRLPVSLGMPSDAIMEMSNRCDLHCVLCTTGGLRASAPHVRRGEMTFDTFRIAMDKMAPWLEKVLLYNWGEPFLNPSLCRCVRYAARKGVATQLSTNMQLYTHRLGADLLAAGLTKLTVSCDGLSQETYARYRVGGDLQRVKTGVQHLLALKAARRAVYPLIEVQFIVFRHNEHEMEAFARYWRDVGVDRVSFIRMSFMSRAGRRRAEQLGMVPTNDQWTPHFPYGKVRECRDLYRHVSVDWDGGIYTCCFPSGEDVYALGNIVTGNLRRVWNGPRYRYARRLVAHRRCDGRWYETMCHDCVGIYPSPAATRYWFEPAARPDQKAA